MITRLKNTVSLLQIYKKRNGALATEKEDAGRDISTSLLDVKHREGGGTWGAVSNSEAH